MTGGRPKLLLLAQCLPFPPHSGVTKRTLNILKQLALEFDVALVSFFRRNHQPTHEARDSAITALRASAREIGPPARIPNEWSVARLAWDHVRSLCSGRPYTYYEYASEDFRGTLETTLRRADPDLVHLDSLDLHGYFDDLPEVPSACTHHNIESELLLRRAQALRFAPARRYMELQARRVERLERDISERFALNVLVSERDERILRGFAPLSRTAVVPNGVDTTFFAPPEGDRTVPGRVVFLGPTYMFPNRDAVDWFTGAVWPEVRRERRGAAFHIIGACREPDRRRYEAVEGVVATGFVKDIRPPLSEAACAVVPIRVGGGTRLKILDAWAMRLPVVSTSVGCEGLDARDGENILVRDTAAGFASAVTELLEDRELADRLGTAARVTAVTTYDWSVVGRGLRREYRKLLG